MFRNSEIKRIRGVSTPCFLTQLIRYDMLAPNNDGLYPFYFLHMSGEILYAFTGRCEMYKIEKRGTNKNAGVAIDYYRSRSMVLKHWRMRGKQLNATTFKVLISKLLTAYLDKIVPNE